MNNRYVSDPKLIEILNQKSANNNYVNDPALIEKLNNLSSQDQMNIPGQNQEDIYQDIPNEPYLTNYLNQRMNRGPENTLQDLGAGLLRGGQNVASLLGETGQAIGSIANPLRKYIPDWMKVIPKVNIREEMGLGQDRPVDLSKLLASKNANPFAVGAGQMLPGIVAGGASLPGQVLSNAVWGGIQAQPGQENAFGILPEGRIGGAIEGGALGAIPGITSLGARAVKSVANLPRAFYKINPEDVAKSVQLSHDTLEKEATDIFKNVSNEVKRRNIDNFPIRSDLIDDISNHLPNTTRNKALLEEARKGNYEGLRDLQSDLWKRGTKALSSDLQADINSGEVMMDLRDEINNGIINHFKNNGHHDLAENLQQGVAKYYDLKKIYFHPKLSNSIKNLVHPESRKIPDNILNVLSENSIPMERVRAHSGSKVSRKIELNKAKEKAQKDFKTIGIGSGIGSLPIVGGLLYKNIFSQPKK